MDLDAAVNDLTQLFLADQECNFQIELLVRIGTVSIAQILGIFSLKIRRPTVQSMILETRFSPMSLVMRTLIFA